MKTLSSPRSKSLIDLMQNYNTEINQVDDYKRFSEEVRPGMIEADRLKIADSYISKMTKLSEKATNDADNSRLAISQAKNGDLKVQTFTSPAARQAAELAFSSALSVVNSKSENVYSIIETACRQQRREFVFSVLSLADEKTATGRFASGIKFGKELADKTFGIDQMRLDEVTHLNTAQEMNDHITLLTDSPKDFETRAGIVTKLEAENQEA